MESALVELYAEVGGPDQGVALAAVGSLARYELGPRSDLDLVLLHLGTDPPHVRALADRLWYPLWDARVRLDHSVRTPVECAEVAGQELSAGVGLLDLRLIAGDASLVAGARSALLGAWRSSARRRLPELLASLDERRESFGDAAYLLEPDLKEARGGFRDMSMLRALAATWLTDRPHEGVREPYERLLDVRDALHLSSGRSLDRLLFGEVDEVAARLGYDEPDALHRDVSMAARRIEHAVDLTGRAARQALPQRRVLSFARRERRPVYTSAGHGLIIHAGEVALGPGTSARDPLVGLRAGALAAQHGLVLSPVTAENLGGQAPALPTPWPPAAREALLEMLSSGDHLVPVWEALDLADCIVGWIPAWEPIRAQPQHNPVHRHTVDRHSVQTVAEAHRFLTQVERPDLLLLAALFHDIGKLPGVGIDHARVGAPIARAAVAAMGLDEADAELVELLVREHLTLAELATKRDHADPATQAALVEAVQGRADVLDLLRGLTEADARAAGPTAWSAWRASLISALAEQTRSRLVHRDQSAPATPPVDADLARLVAADGRPRLSAEARPGGVELVVAVRDRLGLFGDLAGLFAAHAVAVRSAVLHTVVVEPEDEDRRDGAAAPSAQVAQIAQVVQRVAVTTWRVDKARPQDLPDLAVLITELQRLEAGDETVLEPLRRREARAQRVVEHAWVDLVAQASATAAVLEVRTADRDGLLSTLGRALSRAHFSIRSAHIATLAGQAIDTFYLTEADGTQPDADRSREALAVLGEAAAPSVTLSA